MKSPSLKMCRWSLATLWILASVFIAAVLAAISLNRGETVEVQELWQWYVTTFMPTLGLIISVLRANRFADSTPGRAVSSPYFWTTFFVSAVYLVFAFAPIAFFAVRDIALADLLTLSNLWLGPWQGIVAYLIGGVFFTASDETI